MAAATVDNKLQFYIWTGQKGSNLRSQLITTYDWFSHAFCFFYTRYVKKHIKHLTNNGSPAPDSASEMTYIVSSGALNSTHSLTRAR